MTLMQFPPAPWIPDVDILHEAAQILLAAAGGALDLHGLGEPFTRRVITQGTEAPVARNGDQLAVVITKIAPGKPGAEQYRLADGVTGQVDMEFASFVVALTKDWPILSGGHAPSLPSPEKLDEAADQLWRCVVVVRSAMRALMLGGIKPSPTYPGGQVIVRQTVPKGNPSGGRATWETTVEVQVA